MSTPMGIFTVTWHGHSCFSIYNRVLKKKIYIDPFGPNTGRLKLPRNDADLVLCTHDHFDHNNCEGVIRWDGVKIIGLIGDRNIMDIKIRGVEAYHDESGGRKRGRVSLYVVGYGDGVFIHLGDLGHILSDEEISRLQVFGRPHVVFVPVGGVYTIGPEEAVTVIRQLNPRVAVPMHYYSDKLNQAIFSKLLKVDDFLRIWDGPIKKFHTNEIEINVNELPKETTVYLPRYP